MTEDSSTDFEVVPVTKGLKPLLRALKVHKNQRNMVASNKESLKESKEKGAWARALMAGDKPVGFMMLFDPSIEGADPDDCPADAVYLWRLMIDRHHQGKGYGRMAVDAAVAYAIERGARRLLVSYVPETGSPEPFYRGLGFEPTGRIVDDEVEMERLLTSETA